MEPGGCQFGQQVPPGVGRVGEPVEAQGERPVDGPFGDFSDPEGRKLGTIHVLKDITERKRAEEKYRNLVASVQEGVFISTLQGRFLDFNVALMRIVGYENRDELLRVRGGVVLVQPEQGHPADDRGTEAVLLGPPDPPDELPPELATA